MDFASALDDQVAKGVLLLLKIRDVCCRLGGGGIGMNLGLRWRVVDFRTDLLQVELEKQTGLGTFTFGNLDHMTKSLLKLIGVLKLDIQLLDLVIEVHEHVAHVFVVCEDGEKLVVYGVVGMEERDALVARNCAIISTNKKSFLKDRIAYRLQ